MKKYTKPQLFMEEFTMAESIARCGINHPEDYPGGGQGMFDVKINFYADRCDVQIDLGDFGIKSFFRNTSCGEELSDTDLKGWGICYQGNQDDSMMVYGS